MHVKRSLWLAPAKSSASPTPVVCLTLLLPLHSSIKRTPPSFHVDPNTVPEYLHRNHLALLEQVHHGLLLCFTASGLLLPLIRWGFHLSASPSSSVFLSYLSLIPWSLFSFLVSWSPVAGPKSHRAFASLVASIQSCRRHQFFLITASVLHLSHKGEKHARVFISIGYFPVASNITNPTRPKSHMYSLHVLRVTS